MRECRKISEDCKGTVKKDSNLCAECAKVVENDKEEFLTLLTS